MTACDFIELFLEDPDRYAAEARGRLPELLDHAQSCDVCGPRLEQSAGTERVYAALAGPESSQQAQELDELLRSEQEREAQLREVIHSVLIPSLCEQAQGIARSFLAKGFDPLDLYAATEGASLLMRGQLSPGHAPFVELTEAGRVYFGAEETARISEEEMTLEVARFADLWEGENEHLKASPEARTLVRWIYLAALDQTDLLRHFRVDRLATHAGNGIADHGRVRFFPLAVTERIDDPAARWAPCPAFDQFLLAEPTEEGNAYAVYPIAGFHDEALPAGMKEGSVILAATADLYRALGREHPRYPGKAGRAWAPERLGEFAIAFKSRMADLTAVGQAPIEVPAMRIGFLAARRVQFVATPRTHSAEM